jgi:hypothetical protein
MPAQAGIQLKKILRHRHGALDTSLRWYDTNKRREKPG